MDIARLGAPRRQARALGEIRDDLAEGPGFSIVEGLPVDGSAAEEFRRFGAALGRPLAQNARRERLVEIADFTDEDAFDERGYRSPGELTPHTDPSPLIALLCLRPARAGGENRLVSAVSVHHAIHAARPDLLAELEAGFAFYIPDDRREGAGEIRPAMPLLAEGPGGLSCVYYRPFIEQAAEVSGVPMRPAQRDALDLFDTYAMDPAFQYRFALAPGETLIVNNFRVLHARDAYEDWPEKARRRRLLRLWLDADWLPDPPPAHAQRRDPMARLFRDEGPLSRPGHPR